jgi:REP element-mobilizing transposase RayT
MSLFQKSVEKKYMNELDKVLIEKKYAAFQKYFGNPDIQDNIRNSKEEQFQEGFLNELFVNILEYTLNPQPNFNLTTELKNIANSKKADGAILKGKDALAIIELKSTNTTDLDAIETQAFGYKNHHPKCVYVITSNFEKLRFYIQNAVDHIDFDLFNLTPEQFSLLWLCLSKDNLLNDLPLKIKESSVLQEENITKKLYADYSKFREVLYNNLVDKNPDADKLLLFKKTQKLLDRFLFIFFAEDRLLLPPNSISEIVKQWITLKDELDEYVPLYDRFKKYFGYMNSGYKGKKYDIFPYNGGLFAPDELLDNISIDDDILHQHTLNLSHYDFETDVDVNILGHIFEHSLGEIENVQAEIKGEKVDAQKTKRKKDGIFYTPKYITKYIVENTVGKLCEEKRKELDIVDEEYAKGRKNRRKDTIKALDEKLTQYRDWLLTLTILDPACGSGAFLNQALEFLIIEHQKIDDLRAQLFGGGMVFSDITTDILEKNIYGVDLNEESVEIAKLSLWLRTARKGRKLNTLSNNIKCGNSLIDDPTVAGEKAFDWKKEFPAIFTEKEKKAWHITTATHNSRYSQRMFDNHVKLGEPVWLSEVEEKIVTETIAEIAEKDQLNILAYNICGDHMHLLLVCEQSEIPKITGKLKAMSARACNIAMGRTVAATPIAATRGHAPLSVCCSPLVPRYRTRLPLLRTQCVLRHLPVG